MAEYLGVDVLLVRLGFVVTAFFGGLGVIAYLLGWIVLPVAPSATACTADRRPPAAARLRAGRARSARRSGDHSGGRFDGDGAFWPLVLIGLGAAVLWLRTRDLAHAPPAARGPLAATTGRRPTRTTQRHHRAAPDASRRRARRPPTAPRRPDRGRTWARSRGARSSCSPAARGCSTPPASVDVDLGVMFALALALVGAALVVSAWFGRVAWAHRVGHPARAGRRRLRSRRRPARRRDRGSHVPPQHRCRRRQLVHPGHRQPLGRPA